MSYRQDGRQSGRTTRMLKHARALAEEGRQVYVVADNEDHARDFRRRVGKGVKIETPKSLGNLVWEDMRLLGAHPNCVLLVDHYAIERRHRTILEMLHRYDRPAQ